SGWPVFKLHTQRETARSKHFLDLVERLTTQVRRLQQLVLGALDQVTDVVDVFGLQAVGRTDGQLQLVDRTQQDWVECCVATWTCRCVKRSQLATFQLCKHGQLFHQDLGRCADCILGSDRAVGLDLHNQLVQVSTLLNTS